MTESTPPPQSKRAWLRLLQWAVSLILVAWIILEVDWAALPGLFVKIDPVYFPAAILLNAIGGILIPAWITYRTANYLGSSVRLLRLVTINLSIRFYTMILPQGITTAIRFTRYRQVGYQSGKSAALILFEKFAYLAATSWLTLIALLAEPRSLPAFMWGIVWLVFCAGVLSVAAMAPYSSGRSQRYFRRHYDTLMRCLRRSPSTETSPPWQILPGRMLALLLGASLASQLVLTAGHYLLLLAANIPLGFVTFLWVKGLALMLSQLPLSTGGYSARAFVYVSLLPLLGFSADDGLLFSALVYLPSVCLALIGALVEIYALWYFPASTKPPSNSQSTTAR